MIKNLYAVASGLRYCLPICAAAALLLSASNVRADLVVSAQSVAAAAGSPDALDVTLTNSGPGAVTIAGFAFELTVPSTDITFTGVNTSTSTAPYIFDGQSLFGPNIGISVTNQDILASDIFSVIGSGATLGSGVTVGLGHVTFDVSSSAGGSYPVTIVPFPATSLADPDGNNVDIASLNGGAIRVTGGTPVPEPGTLALLAGLVIPGACFLVRRRN